MAAVGRIDLSDIALDRLVAIKSLVSVRNGEDHSRWIFRSPRGSADPLVIKLWNPTYLRRDTLVPALESGFYGAELTPGLRALVFRRGVCRGYVMEFGARPAALDPDFVRRLWLATLTRRWFAKQYRPSHLRRVSAGVTLIDLEEVWPIDSPEGSSGPAGFDDNDYAALVAAVRAGGVAPADALALARAHMASAATRPANAAPPSPAWFARKADGLSRRLRQSLRNALGVSRRGLLQID